MMIRKISFFLAIFLLMSQLLSTPAGIQATESNGVTLVDDSNVYQQTKFYKDSLFGIAGGFHLVGLNSVKNNVHINGNILTNKLIYGSDFGTFGVEEATYIRDIESGTAITIGGHEASILVLGKELKVGTVDNGNAWSVNGNKVNRPYKSNSPNHLWQDGEREFIDLKQVEQHAVQLVSQLAKLENSLVDINNRDHNKQEVIVAQDKNFNVYNLKKGDFSFSNPIHIKGFEKNKASTLIMNVDMNQMDNKDSFIIPNSVAHYTDGSSVSIGHVTEWSNANVVWNIYDSSNENNLYTGTIKNSAAVTGSILAPKATVTLDHNLNGTVIAKDIIVNGETHRDGYVNPEKTPDPKMIEVAVEKVWEGEVQDSVTVHLLANGAVVDSVELSDANGWEHLFTDLPEENEGGKIEYRVEEVPIEGYETLVTGNAEDGFVVTNTEVVIEPDTTEVAVEKVWEGKVQDSVTIKLLANGIEVDAVDLSDLNDWQHTFTNLPIENDHGSIEYNVEEVAISGYEVEITGNEIAGFVITNREIIEPETTEVTVEKVWEGKALETVMIHLLANGKPINTVVLSDVNDWQHTFTNLPVENEAGAIEYRIEEVAIDGYEITISGDTVNGFTVINTEVIEPKTTEITVNKVWEGKAQDSVTINLLADGTVVGTIELSGANNWQHTFMDLPVNSTDGAIEYTIEEVAIDGYEVTITGDVATGFIVTNTEVEAPEPDPEPEDPIEEEKEQGPKDGGKLVSEKKETGISPKETGKLLPSTATSLFNLLLIGSVLLLIGGLGYYLLRKKGQNNS